MTLVEVVTAVGLVALVTAATVRGWAAEVDRTRVTEAESAVVQAYRAAQQAARTRGRPAVLLVTPDRLEILSAGVADTAIVWTGPGPAAVGVGLSPRRHQAVFGPSGMANGAANVTHTFWRGAVTRQVVVSRLGRLRID